MGIISVDLFITLDGVYQGPGGQDEDRAYSFELGGWQGAYVDAESGEAISAGIERMDALLLGRKAYDIFAGYWPALRDTNPIAAKLNAVPKFVDSRMDFSQSLAWLRPSTRLRISGKPRSVRSARVVAVDQSVSSVVLRDITLEDMCHYVAVIMSALAELAANLAPDVYSDVSMSIRGLQINLGLSRWPKRRQGRIDTHLPDCS